MSGCERWGISSACLSPAIAPLLYPYVVPFPNTIYIVKTKVCFLTPYSDAELC